MAEQKKMWPVWSVIILIIAYLGYLHFADRPKTGYVLIQDVYNQFEMKKELQKKFETSHGARQKVLDSTLAILRMLNRKINDEKGKDTGDIGTFRRMRVEYMEKKSQMAGDDSAQTKQYDTEIITQLNQYIKDYAKENGYQYIFGNGGNGSLMAADESVNITGPVTQYVNEKYAGKK